MLSRRNLIGRFLLGVFASISLFGHGLHYLPQANHFSAERTACDHGCHHGSAPVTDEDPTLDHSCPICRFLAQAQCQFDLQIDFPFAYSFELANERRPLKKPLPLLGLHLARAPPWTSTSFIG